MATGVQPRDEELQFTRSDLENIQDAMKNKKFREMLAEYADEVRDPANQALYQKEMTQLEKERGYDVTFINPKGGYVIKTSVAGDRKAFVNICSNDYVGKPSCSVQEVDNQRGMNWQIPYTIIPPREDYDHKKQRCVIYDVVFHPDTLRMAEVNKRFRELVNKTALDGLMKTYNIHLDNNNLRFPKSLYKGMTTPAIIRKEDPDFKGIPLDDEEGGEPLSPEVLEKLYPQRTFPAASKSEEIKSVSKSKPKARSKKEFTHETINGYTIPKYIIKQQKNVDMQEFTYDKNSKQYTAIPSQIVVEIYLPLLSSTKDCILDVKEKSLSLSCEKPAKYKLAITLPYAVNDENGSAKFDKTKHMLIVTLPVVRENMKKDSSKADSGVESEENLSSQSDDDQRDNLVEELSSTVAETAISPPTQQLEHKSSEEIFLDPSYGYILPSYTHNVLDDIVAFTFHVKNTEPDSVKVMSEGNKVYIKFTTVGSGFVPVHYAALIVFDEVIRFEDATGEPWDNNVILQLEVSGNLPEKFQIGLSDASLTSEYFDMSQVKKPSCDQSTLSQKLPQDEISLPVVEVTNLGSETNIVVSSNIENEDSDDVESPRCPKEKEIVWVDSGMNETGAKSILRKPMHMMRSFSESSVGDVASSMDYVSSDCIPEESSLKKTVRFNDVIAKQFYRYNSSIEGQKKKNQRKKSKKRTQDRCKSESEAEDDINNSPQIPKSKPKSTLKQRRDSGLADTSDVESECRGTPTGRGIPSERKDDGIDTDTSDGSTPSSVFDIYNKNNSRKSEPVIWKSEDEDNESKSGEAKASEPKTCDNIKHNTDLYDPDKLNKGQYQEVMFKNDLIFDLDM
ncbi:protein kintoun [Cydia strobilella]|uniref:protein kintoun n=1 Tax=Cydia strobilella TaxID=1100964 RepID=UPI0030054215